MTANQLAFQKNQETRRHNLEMEREQEFANMSGRLQAYASQSQATAAMSQAATAAARQAEDAAHNRVTEKQGAWNTASQVVDKIGSSVSAFAKTIF